MEIYVSQYMKNTDRGKPVFEALQKINGEVEPKEIPANKNEWCRDYMPVRGSQGQLVLFKYRPSYLLGSKTNEATIPDQKAICDTLGLQYEPSDVILDGRAIEIFEDVGIISDRVYSTIAARGIICNLMYFWK